MDLQSLTAKRRYHPLPITHDETKTWDLKDLLLLVLVFQGEPSDKKKTESTSSYNYRVVKEVCLFVFLILALMCATSIAHN